MRFIYFARVFFVSFEFVVLGVTALCVKFFEPEVNAFASVLVVNEDLMKFAILVPISLLIWCIKEGRDLVFSNPEHAKILVNWPDYWKLKQHVTVSLIFLAIFCLLSGFPCLSKSGITTGRGLILFVAGLVGCMVVALQLYAAKMSINEIMYLE